MIPKLHRRIDYKKIKIYLNIILRNRKPKQKKKTYSKIQEI